MTEKGPKIYFVMKAMAMAESEILPIWAAPPLSAFFSGGPQEKEARPRARWPNRWAQSHSEGVSDEVWVRHSVSMV